MPINDKQKIITLEINAQSEQVIKDRLADGYVIQSITNLQPSVNRLLIVYATPETI
jgi:hypothetical protein